MLTACMAAITTPMAATGTPNATVYGCRNIKA